MKFLVTVLLILLCSVNALSCSCLEKGKIDVKEYNSYDYIFIGILVNEQTVNEDYYRRLATYKVIQLYKGKMLDSTINIYDAGNMSACGLDELTIGDKYLIFAKGREKKVTSDCLRTTLVPNHKLPADSALVSQLINLKSFGRIFQPERSNFHADTLFLNHHISRTREGGIKTFYGHDGKIFAKGAYKDGEAEGYWEYYENDSIAGAGKYINGLKDSLWMEPYMKNSFYLREYKDGEYTYRRQYFYDGKLRRKTEPIGDGEKWIKYDYHANGEARYVAYTKPPQRDKNGYLQDVVSHGRFKMFNKKGIILQEGIQENGYYIGRWKYYYEDGKLRMEGNYIKGEKEGIWKIYYPNKTIKATGWYKQNKKDGIWLYYNNKGIGIPPDPKLIEEDEDWFTYSGEKN